ncbi:hypothetical protein Ancab_034480 [Ancistrocladus abbreviatus]
MTSITISSTTNGNGFVDLMKFKVTARHISYRNPLLHHANHHFRCHLSSFSPLLLPLKLMLSTSAPHLKGRRGRVGMGDIDEVQFHACRWFGPKLPGRDDSGRLVRDIHMILSQVNPGEIPPGLNLPELFSQLVSDMKSNQYDAKTFAFMLKAMVAFGVGSREMIC